jgi:hypothetical protein
MSLEYDECYQSQCPGFSTLSKRPIFRTETVVVREEYSVGVHAVGVLQHATNFCIYFLLSVDAKPDDEPYECMHDQRGIR